MTTLPRNAMVVRAPSDLPVSLAPAARFHRDPQGSTSIHIIFSQPDRHRIATQMWALQQQRLDFTRLFSRVDFLAQGRTSEWLHLYAAVPFSCVCFSRSGPRVPAGTRTSLRPLGFEGGVTKQSSGETRREDAKACLQIEPAFGG